MRSTHPIVPLSGPLVTLTKSEVENTLRTSYQQKTASVPSLVARSTSKWVELTAVIVASFFSEEAEETTTRSPSSKTHSSGQGNSDPVRAGCEESLNSPNIRVGAPTELMEIECRTKSSRSSPWSKTSPRKV